MTVRLLLPNAKPSSSTLRFAVCSQPRASRTHCPWSPSPPAGVTKPVLYQHFPSKRDSVPRARRTRSAPVWPARSATPPRRPRLPHEQVTAGFAAYFDFVADHPDQFRLLFGEGVRTDPEFAMTVAAVENELAGFVAALIEIDGLDDDGRLLLAHGIVGLAEGTGRHWIATGASGCVVDLAAQVADLAWLGLRGRRRDLS
ncbi:MAG: TetR/AcrR family transcriptional regulator [Acidimicrobiales bacterium]